MEETNIGKKDYRRSCRKRRKGSVNKLGLQGCMCVCARTHVCVCARVSGGGGGMKQTPGVVVKGTDG